MLPSTLFEIDWACATKRRQSTGQSDHGGRVDLLRIGHPGDLNEPMVRGTLGSTEMGLRLNGVPHGKGGVEAAMDYLAS